MCLCIENYKELFVSRMISAISSNDTKRSRYSLLLIGVSFWWKIGCFVISAMITSPLPTHREVRLQVESDVGVMNVIIADFAQLEDRTVRLMQCLGEQRNIIHTSVMLDCFRSWPITQKQVAQWFIVVANYSDTQWAIANKYYWPSLGRETPLLRWLALGLCRLQCVAATTVNDLSGHWYYLFTTNVRCCSATVIWNQAAACNILPGVNVVTLNVLKFSTIFMGSINLRISSTCKAFCCHQCNFLLSEFSYLL